MKTRYSILPVAWFAPLRALAIFAVSTGWLPAAPLATLDPDFQAVLAELQALDPKPIETLSPREARRQPTPAEAVVAHLKATDQKATPEKVSDIDDRAIPGPAGKIPVRVYTPQGAGPFPVIVYYHGGGFVIADLDTYDATPRTLANLAGAVVVSAHYRQGPEHKFPAAHDDAFAAYRWVLANGPALNADTSRVAVAGESAGGNLAAAVALQARDQKVRAPVHQLLVYPVADNDMDRPSYRENVDAKPLNKAMMAWFFKHAAEPGAIDDPRLGLLKSADLKGLPPATIITAQADPLRSEGEALARKFREAGVPVEHRNFEGVGHEFFGMGAAVQKARQAQQFAAAQLRQAFGAPALAAGGSPVRGQ